MSPDEAATPLNAQQEAILRALTTMRLSLERLPAERQAIKTAPVRERQYRQGFCDGTEEAIAAISECFRPLTSEPTP